MHSSGRRLAPGARIAALLLGAPAVALLLAACVHVSGAGSPFPAGEKVDHGVTYCRTSGVSLKMDIYYPNGLTGTAPAVVWVHGGGWELGGRRLDASAPGVNDVLAAGFIVASIDYRLGPKYKFPAQIEDVKCAIRFLRADASRYHVDSAHIGIWGASSGGHLAALAGLAGPDAGFEGQGHNDQPSTVQAVVDMFGPADLEAPGFVTMNPQVAQDVFGAIPGQPTDVFKRASPTTYVSGNAPPFFIIQGDSDHTVPPSQSQELYDRLKAAGADASLLMVKNGDHGLQPVGGPLQPTQQQVNDLIVAFFQRTLR